MIRFHTSTTDDDILVLGLDGDVDQYTAEDVFQEIETQIVKGHRRIILDCSDLHYLSSSGVATLIRVQARMKKLGGDVRLASIHGMPADVFTVLHLDGVVPSYPSLDDARQSFRN